MASAKAARSFANATRSSGRFDRQVLLAAGLVLTDLSTQDWQFRVNRGRVEVRPPVQMRGDRATEKAHIRRLELVKRNAQLKNPSVQKFLQSMERTRMFNGRFVSIFSLLRDGRELAESLRVARAERDDKLREALASAVDPYLEFVSSEEATCPLTGLKLMDIWRYFRHTWSNQYASVPGRSMMFLVRDRAVPLCPIIGIGALSSPVMQIRERDTWIGWHPDTFLPRIEENPTDVFARWLVDLIDTGIGELFVDDLLEDGVLNVRNIVDPDDMAIDRLFKESEQQRRLHHRYVRSRDHKKARKGLPETEYWGARARTHLFRSKRALALALT